MKKFAYIFVISVLIIWQLFVGLNITRVEAASGDALWAKSTSTVAFPNPSEFFDTAMDTNGNAYAVGYIYGDKEFNFGNGVTITGKTSFNNNVIVSIIPKEWRNGLNRQ